MWPCAVQAVLTHPLSVLVHVQDETGVVVEVLDVFPAGVECKKASRFGGWRKGRVCVDVLPALSVCE